MVEGSDYDLEIEEETLFIDLEDDESCEFDILMFWDFLDFELRKSLDCDIEDDLKDEIVDESPLSEELKIEGGIRAMILENILVEIDTFSQLKTFDQFVPF